MLTKFVVLSIAFIVSFLLTLTTLLYLNHVPTNAPELSSAIRFLQNFQSKNNTEHQCSPLYPNVSNYEVSLEGRQYPQVVPIYLNKSLNFDCLNSGPLKRILYWNPFWWSKTYDFGVGVRTPFEKHKCPVTNCEVTNDRAMYNCSDLVLFHAFNLLKSNASAQLMPTHRPDGQRWVFTYFESPVTFESMCYKNLEGKFSLLNTYHADSDFNSVYYTNAFFEWKRNATFDPDYDYHVKKVSIFRPHNYFNTCRVKNTKKTKKQQQKIDKVCSCDDKSLCGSLVSEPVHREASAVRQRRRVRTMWHKKVPGRQYDRLPSGHCRTVQVLFRLRELSVQ